MTSNKLVVANWKMNGGSALVDAYVEAFANDFAPSAKVAACVPYPFISSAKAALETSTPLTVGAQDISAKEDGAYTGEVSAAMLVELGVSYAVVGHSERRQYHQESDQLVAEKVKAALAAGIAPILCIGESLELREAGNTLDFLKQQIDAVLGQLQPEDFTRLVIAYEPIWAIGTGVAATIEMVEEAHTALRGMVNVHAGEQGPLIPLLYGGSVNDANAEEIFAVDNVDGGLVGGASLKPEAFKQVCLAAK